MSNPYVTPELFSFLEDLKTNNDRDWFKKNKTRYEQILKEPLLDMIADFSPLLSQISPHFRAIPKAVGGSLFRIYRDVRFSKNKNPYKTHVGIHFRHERAKDVHAPGYYLHVEPGNVFFAMGIWRPDNKILTNIRSSIVDNPDSWLGARDEPGFEKLFHLEGDSLKRPPRGFDPDHPLVTDLKRKDFIAVANFSEEAVLRPDVLPHLADVWMKGSPFMRFLADSLSLKF